LYCSSRFHPRKKEEYYKILLDPLVQAQKTPYPFLKDENFVECWNNIKPATDTEVYKMSYEIELRKKTIQQNEKESQSNKIPIITLVFIPIVVLVVGYLWRNL